MKVVATEYGNKKENEYNCRAGVVVVGGINGMGRTGALVTTTNVTEWRR